MNIVQVNNRPKRIRVATKTGVAQPRLSNKVHMHHGVAYRVPDKGYKAIELQAKTRTPQRIRKEAKALAKLGVN